MQQLRIVKADQEIQPLLSASITPRDATVTDGRGGSSNWVSSAALFDQISYLDGEETRRCNDCGGTMTSGRFQRSMLRYLRVFECGRCQARFKQESRGYQGFYFGTSLMLAGPALWACYATKKIPVTAHIPVVVAVAILFLPFLWNLALYIQAPVLQKGKGRNLTREESRRCYLMRILGGSRTYVGMFCGLVVGLSIYLLAASTAIVTSFF